MCRHISQARPVRERPGGAARGEPAGRRDGMTSFSITAERASVRCDSPGCVRVRIVCARDARAKIEKVPGRDHIRIKNLSIFFLEQGRGGRPRESAQMPKYRIRKGFAAKQQAVPSLPGPPLFPPPIHTGRSSLAQAHAHAHARVVHCSAHAGSDSRARHHHAIMCARTPFSRLAVSPYNLPSSLS